MFKRFVSANRQIRDTEGEVAMAVKGTDRYRRKNQELYRSRRTRECAIKERVIAGEWEMIDMTPFQFWKTTRSNVNKISIINIINIPSHSDTTFLITNYYKGYGP